MAAIGDLVANLRANAAPMIAGLEAAKGGVSRFASFTRSALAPVAGAFAGAFTVSGMLRAAGEQAKAQKMLASQVAGTGEAAGLTTGQMIEFAQSLQKTTNFSAAATEGAMSLLTTFRNVKGDQFKGAIKEAQNLSTVLGVDLTSATRLVGKALNDPVNSLKLLRKAGVQFTAEQQQQIQAMQAAGNMAGAQQIILSQLEGSFGGAAENMASPMTQLSHVIEDVSASLGSILGPGIKVVAQTMAEMLGPLDEARGSLQAFGKLIASFIGAIFKPFGTAIAQTAQLLMGMWAGGSVSAADFGNVAKLAMDNMTLGMMDLLPNGEKVFTAIGVYGAATWEAISTSLASLWENVKSVWTSMVDLAKAVGGAIYAAFQAAWNMEDPIEAAKKAFADGMKQMRETNFQNPLTAGMDKFNDTVRDATQGLAEQGGLKNVLTIDRDKLKRDVKATIDGLPKLPGITVPDFKKHAPIDAGTGGKPGKEKKAHAERQEKLEAFEANSKEALEALAQAARGDLGDTAERTAAAAERTADATERSADVAEDGDDGDNYDGPPG